MDRNTTHLYRTPALIDRGAFSARTMESDILSDKREEFNPDLFRIPTNL